MHVTSFYPDPTPANLKVAYLIAWSAIMAKVARNCPPAVARAAPR